MSILRRGHVLITSMCLLGLANLSFLLGSLAYSLHWPPYEFIHNAYVGIQTYFHQKKEAAKVLDPRTDEVTQYPSIDIKEKTFDGYTLCMMAPGQPKTTLRDMHGNVVHEWDTR